MHEGLIADLTAQPHDLVFEACRSEHLVSLLFCHIQLIIFVVILPGHQLLILIFEGHQTPFYYITRILVAVYSIHGSHEDSDEVVHVFRVFDNQIDVSVLQLQCYALPGVERHLAVDVFRTIKENQMLSKQPEPRGRPTEQYSFDIGQVAATATVTLVILCLLRIFLPLTFDHVCFHVIRLKNVLFLRNNFLIYDVYRLEVVR